ncbi:unnamed protein product [Lymnaea stagnalis]|uniref:G-protein coupled receptors family 1 profile domain-containing protein n=1 Tax=Lymnaea stagnalis TaxID=6523 RepID=A0AAV2GWN5_LYMST
MDSSEMTIMNGTTCPLTPHAVVDAGQVYQPVSDSLRHSIEIFYSVFFTCVIGVLGSAANIINIVVFVKQGFSDAMNISFLGLAIADLCSVVTLVWEGICYNPMFFNSDLPFVTSDLLYYTAGSDVWTICRHFN